MACPASLSIVLVILVPTAQRRAEYQRAALALCKHATGLRGLRSQRRRRAEKKDGADASGPVTGELPPAPLGHLFRRTRGMKLLRR